jgi:hypothetical protein
VVLKCDRHRDFLVHQTYWDLYPDASQIPTAKHPVRDASQPLIAFHPAGFTLPNGSSYPGARRRFHLVCGPF